MSSSNVRFSLLNTRLLVGMSQCHWYELWVHNFTYRGMKDIFRSVFRYEKNFNFIRTWSILFFWRNGSILNTLSLTAAAGQYWDSDLYSHFAGDSWASCNVHELHWSRKQNKTFHWLRNKNIQKSKYENKYSMERKEIRIINWNWTKISQTWNGS